ncbi:MAG TPA: hypothetical protein VK072_00385 [Candidatus Avamphibacillus sp.]|nr:hypothetical protein [Candidatus Avamphibacillus sp.]
MSLLNGRYQDRAAVFRIFFPTGFESSLFSSLIVGHRGIRSNRTTLVLTAK